MKLEIFLLCLVAALVLGRIVLWLVDWFRRAPTTPDPWDTEVAQALESPECLPVCHRCFAPQAHNGWYCPECGAVVGPYANYLPYVYLFSIGEVVRNGVSHLLRRSTLVITGYLLVALSEYLVLAPIYCYFFFKHLKGQGTTKERRIPESE